MSVIDAHVHGFPNRLFHAIWDYFEKNYWAVQKKLEFEEIVQYLPKFGVSNFTILNYAHMPEISRDLNDWTYSMSKKYPQTIPFGTIHPKDSYFHEEVIRVLSPDHLDFFGLKFQLMVTDFDPNDASLDYMYEKLIEFSKILVMHVGTGPVPDMLLNKSLKINSHVGIDKLIPVLERYPKLKLQVPHLGCMETNAFFDLVLDYPQIHFDTSMALEFLFGESKSQFSQDMELSIDRLVELQDNIIFGSDFPNIPHAYSTSLNAIKQLRLTQEIRNKFLYKNAQKFYNLK
ncbi:MAG: amidohydrolase [Candidatus Lokiarchaeota archaeon]|nr:amidohydrolase [Candidatus Lokiarchaeota archaeon]